MNPNASKARNRRRKNGFLGLLNGLLSLVVFGLLLVGGVLVLGAQRFYTEGQSTEDSVFLVQRGAALSSISQQLEADGLVADRWTFQIGTVAKRQQSSIRAGEYLIPAGASMSEILEELTVGRPISYSVTIPEGYTSWDIVARINQADNLVGELTDIPLEGSLLPNTYGFERGAERQSIIDQMRTALDEALPEIWESRDPDLPLASPEELVILASVVEKETGLASERPQVAAVFINRLNQGIRLQSDPTIIYGITNGQEPLGRGLRRSEIDAETPYNTYQIDGLPAGPISNPGIESLRAVANPADTDALYFVADGTGGHAFANSYSEHQDNVARWRQIEREREAEADAARVAAEQSQTDQDAEA